MIESWEKYCQKIIEKKRWFPWKFESLSDEILCEGAVCQLKKDGRPNYRKYDKSTRDKVFIPSSELKKMEYTGVFQASCSVERNNVS